MHLIQRAALRRTVQRLKAEGQIDAAAAKSILRPRALSALNSRVDNLAIVTRKAPAVAQLGDGKLLAWLWANREAIVAFIAELVKLFK